MPKLGVWRMQHPDVFAKAIGNYFACRLSFGLQVKLAL